jgi:hypothetical protein
MQAGVAIFSCSESPVTSQKPSRFSATARPDGPKEGPGRDRAARILGRASKPGTANRKLEKDAEGKSGIYGRLESSEARARAPSPIGRPVNPGGQTSRTKITEKWQVVVFRPPDSGGSSAVLHGLNTEARARANSLQRFLEDTLGIRQDCS